MDACPSSSLIEITSAPSSSRLEASVVRIDLGPTRKRSGELGEIDRFGLEYRHDARGQAFQTGEMPACKVEFEDIGEHGSMIHGVIS
jgi:hypothetical protein